MRFFKSYFFVDKFFLRFKLGDIEFNIRLVFGDKFKRLIISKILVNLFWWI